MKDYVVDYQITINQDAHVEAKNKREAAKKVREVVGEPLKIVKVWELKD